MNREDYPRIALGAGVILVGLLLLMASVGVFSFGDVLVYLWPIGIILAGLAFMARQWGVGSLLIALSVLAAVFATTSPYLEVPGEQQDYVMAFPGENASSVGIDLSFIGGELQVLGGSHEPYVSLNARDYWEPNARSFHEDEQTVVKVERGMEEPRFGEGAAWNLSVRDNVSAVIALDLVAADAELDLRGTVLDELVISNVASDLAVMLPATNSTVSIDTTASDVVITYPAGVGVRVEYSAVAADVSPLGNFALPADGWHVLNENASTMIMVSVDAVASDVKIVEE